MCSKPHHPIVALCSAALFLFLLMGWPALATAQDVTDDDVNRVAAQLYCPTCESVPVDVCPTQVCQDWRQEIRAQLAAGRSDDQILNYFADRYGEGVLANVPARGIGLVIWLIPVIIVVLGGAIFARSMATLRRSGPLDIPPPPGVNERE